MIRHTCEQCGERLRFDRRLAGLPVRCPECRAQMAVPLADTPWESAQYQPPTWSRRPPPASDNPFRKPNRRRAVPVAVWVGLALMLGAGALVALGHLSQQQPTRITRATSTTSISTKSAVGKEEFPPARPSIAPPTPAPPPTATVYIDNASDKNVTIWLNAAEWKKVAAKSRLSESVPAGMASLTVRDETGTVLQEHTETLTGNGRYVLNVLGTELYCRYRVVYEVTPSVVAPDPQLRIVGDRWLDANGVDYLFVTPPRTISMPSYLFVVNRTALNRMQDVRD